MSAPLSLSAFQLRRLARFLEALSDTCRLNEVNAAAYGPLAVSVDGNVIAVDWDAEAGQYIVMDRVGS